MEIVQQGFQIKSIRMREHFLFNLLNFLYFRKNDCENGFLIENHPLSLFIIIPYIMLSEAYFFRQKRYFIILKQRIAGVLVLREEIDALYISSLAVSPSYRKIGVATRILNRVVIIAERLHKKTLELSVLKTNTPALRLYWKSGFRKKKEKRRLIVMRKNI